MNKTVVKTLVFIVVIGLLVFLLPNQCLAAATSSVDGKAKVLNTDNSYLDFTSTYNSNVTVNNSTGNFSGYGWVEDIGWCDFGTTDNPDGPVNMDLSTGAVTGKAYCLNTAAYIDFTNYESNVVVSLSSGAFSGYGWSEDVGWLDFSDSGVSLTDPGPAISSLSCWTDSTHTTTVPENISQSDGEVSFSWTNLRPISGSWYYWEYNSDSGNTITGDESYATTVYKDDILLLEGTHYFHVRPRVGENGAWGTELVFTIIYDGNDLSTLGAAQQSPDDKAYTSNTTPTFIFKKGNRPIGGINHYELLIDDGWGGGFAFENIPPQYTLNGNDSSEADTFINQKINVYYKDWNDDDADNNLIQVFTLEEDKKLKEGQRKWSVKAVDNAGNSQKAERVLNVDLTKPKVELKMLGLVDFDSDILNWSYASQKPKLSGIVKDPLAGEYITEDNQTKVHSGPKEMKIEFLKKDWAGIYQPYLLSNYSIKDKEGEENGEFDYQPEIPLETGNYQVKLSAWDWAGNHSNALVFNLKISLPSALVSQTKKQEAESVIKEIEKEIGQKISPDQKQEIIEEFQVEGQPEAKKENIFKKLLGWISNSGQKVYWSAAGLVKTTAGRPIAFLFGRTTDTLGGEENSVIRKFIVNADFFSSVWFDKEPTQIYNVRIAETGPDYAVIQWQTNHYASSKVNYGSTYDYGFDVQTDKKTKDHKIRIDNLKPDTSYYYEVMSQGKNYVFDARHEFRTEE